MVQTAAMAGGAASLNPSLRHVPLLPGAPNTGISGPRINSGSTARIPKSPKVIKAPKASTTMGKLASVDSVWNYPEEYLLKQAQLAVPITLGTLGVENTLRLGKGIGEGTQLIAKKLAKLIVTGSKATHKGIGATAGYLKGRSLGGRALKPETTSALFPGASGKSFSKGMNKGFAATADKAPATMRGMRFADKYKIPLIAGGGGTALSVAARRPRQEPDFFENPKTGSDTGDKVRSYLKHVAMFTGGSAAVGGITGLAGKKLRIPEKAIILPVPGMTEVLFGTNVANTAARAGRAIVKGQGKPAAKKIIQSEVDHLKGQLTGAQQALAHPADYLAGEGKRVADTSKALYTRAKNVLPSRYKAADRSTEDLVALTKLFGKATRKTL